MTAAATFTFGPAGVYTAAWDGSAVLTITQTAGGAVLATVSPVVTLAAAQTAAYGFEFTSGPLNVAAGGTGASTTAGALTALGAAPVQGVPWLPSDQGFLAWTHDYATNTATATVTANAGVIQLTRINVRAPLTVTNVSVLVGVGGTSLTAAANFIGLFSSTGTLIGVSADQSAAWASVGLATAALVSGPFVVPAGFCWVGVLANSSGGTTQPGFGKLSAAGSAAELNPGLTVATARYASNGSGLTSLASITPGSNAFLNVPLWAGLS